MYRELNKNIMSRRNHSHNPNALSEIPYVDVDALNIDAFRMPVAGEKSRMITRIDNVATTALMVRIANQYNRYIDIRHPDILPSTPEHREIESAARLFVADAVGVEPVGDVYWQSSSADVEYNGIHSGIYRDTFIKESDSPYPDLKLLQDASTLVHELAHSTGNTGKVNIVVSTGENGTPMHHLHESMVGDILVKVRSERGEPSMVEVGDFYEEAFAEETAARFREQLLPDHIRGAGRLFFADGNSIPARFCNANYSSRQDGQRLTTNSITAIYAAHSLSLLSRASGTDLYALQCQMRHPEQKARAKKQFITAINSVHEGLYQKLRDIPYTKESFTDGLKTVKQTIQHSRTH